MIYFVGWLRALGLCASQSGYFETKIFGSSALRSVVTDGEALGLELQGADQTLEVLKVVPDRLRFGS